MATYEEVETLYADYKAALDKAHGDYPERAYMPHCDQWILHTHGVCVHCDKYPDLQEKRRSLRIAFTGETPGLTQRPCPATMLRPLEKLQRWPGNAPMTQEQFDQYSEEVQAQIDQAVRDFKPSIEDSKKSSLIEYRGTYAMDIIKHAVDDLVKPPATSTQASTHIGGSKARYHEFEERILALVREYSDVVHLEEHRVKVDFGIDTETHQMDLRVSSRNLTPYQSSWSEPNVWRGFGAETTWGVAPTKRMYLDWGGKKYPYYLEDTEPAPFPDDDGGDDEAE